MSDHADGFRSAYGLCFPGIPFGQCWPHIARKWSQGEYASKKWEHFDEVSRLSIRGALDVERGRAARDEFRRTRADVDLGTPREFVWGFFMGFLLGFIMLLYLWERSVSHRQKMGILTGASCQIVGKYLHSGSFRWALI